MLEAIRKFFGLCQHKWVVISEQTIGYKEPREKIIGRLYVQKCEHCGKLREFRTCV